MTSVKDPKPLKMSVGSKWQKRIVLFTLFLMNLVEQPSPDVKLEQGVLTGRISKDGTYYEFTGIPYGVANVSNRFRAPYPPPHWDGVFKAVDEHYACPQPADGRRLVGTEDCLKANVYVPVNADKLPVIFYIPGGAFYLGDGGKGMYGPEFLVRKNVVLVTINYRLGALGFTCLGIKEAPGNAGLKDQLAALRWVKKNIAAFGGDPDNVTIFGESAGSASVGLMLASNTTNGLFNRAISLSGSGIASWGHSRDPIWLSSLLAKALSHKETQDPHEIYDILSKASLEELVLTKIEKPFQIYHDTHFVYFPCVENVLPGVESYITDVPYNLMVSAERKNVSVIYGSTNKEGLFFLSDETEEHLKHRNETYLFSSDLEFSSEKEANETAQVVKKFYFGHEDINFKTILNLSDFYTHFFFEIGALLEADIMAVTNKVYISYFTYDGGRNALKRFAGYTHIPGASHGDDLFYIFNAIYWPFRISAKDQQVIDWMTTLITNFAKYGEPTPANKSNIPIQWSPTKSGDHRVLEIGDELKMRPVESLEAYQMWKDLYSKHRRRKLQKHLFK